MLRYFLIILSLTIFSPKTYAQIAAIEFPGFEGEFPPEFEGEFEREFPEEDPPSQPEPQQEENNEVPGNNSSTGPNGTVSTLRTQLNLQTRGFGGVKINNSGEWGIENLSLHGNLTLTSFDDSSNSVNSSGHFRDYSLSLTGDITPNDSISFGFSSSRYETGGSLGILSRIKGINFSWVHNLNENFGVGVLGFLNQVDIEEVNGNSYSYGYGLLFTSFHSFKYFDLSSATVLAHTDFDTGYDSIFMSSITASRQWTDKFTSYLTLNFTDSFKSDPDNDPTYGSWEVGGVYSFNENLSFSLGFARTEFLNNYSDNTFLLGVSWYF